MNEHQASRTLVKSPPELWAECSDARSLARHLGDAVGEIRIKRLEPETTVAWEGERISGTVRLEPSGWGTKVTLTATTEPLEMAEPPEPVAVTPPEPMAVDPPEPVAVTTPEPMAVPAPRPPVRQTASTRFLARVRRWFMPELSVVSPTLKPPVEPTSEPAPAPSEPVVPPEPVTPPEPATNRVDLIAALDSLGKAHHRPFSRA
jgi:hypothetical protein